MIQLKLRKFLILTRAHISKKETKVMVAGGPRSSIEHFRSGNLNHFRERYPDQRHSIT
jgi:hypothetical protein